VSIKPQVAISCSSLCVYILPVSQPAGMSIYWYTVCQAHSKYTAFIPTHYVSKYHSIGNILIMCVVTVIIYDIFIVGSTGGNIQCEKLPLIHISALMKDHLCMITIESSSSGIPYRQVNWTFREDVFSKILTPVSSVWNICRRFKK
jgi:hypothetical protein